MSPSTFKLHEQLFRHAAGMVAAYKAWLDKQVLDNPDPADHFKEVDEQIKQQSARAK